MKARLKPSVMAVSMACASIALCASAMAAEPAILGEVLVSAKKSGDSTFATTLNSRDIADRRATTSDTASLLQDIPGVSVFSAGGISGLPVIHGLADDRLRIAVDGVDAIASCPNHMNSPLSYIDPSHLESLQVFSGVAPVSVGGDSIGGTVLAMTKAPLFARPGEGVVSKGEIGAVYRSNGDASSVNASASVANESLSFTYSGAQARSGNYRAGGDFHRAGPAATDRLQIIAADEVASTAYKSTNQNVALAVKGGDHLVELKFGWQDIPYELYPNQRMDMLGNTQERINLRYEGQYSWGKLEARAYHEEVDHFMDFGADKQYLYGNLGAVYTSTGVAYPVPGMPMYTSSSTNGLSMQGDVTLSERDILRVGGLLQTYRLDDWWPPAPDCGVGNCIGGMAPYTFWNINDGKRDRKALFGEWEARWNPQWMSLLGLRFERVTTDTGTVSGYSDMAVPGASVGGSVTVNGTPTAIAPGTSLPNVPSAMGMAMGMMYNGSGVGTRAAFNAMDRKRTDNNWDMSAMTTYRRDDTFEAKFGFGRKTRSPNLYERYSWSTNTMAMVMNNFVGDGNGYVGNPNLKPEVAHTLSMSGDWHSADGEYQFVATPYFTRVSDYIDAQRTYPGSTNANATATNAYVRLQYVNQDARLYGIDLSGKMPLGRNLLGRWGAKGQLSYLNGKNLDTKGNLYNIMPLNAKAVLTHQLGDWSNAFEVVAVAGKHDVSSVRNEIQTSGYTLLNLRSSYQWGKVRLDFGVENLLDKLYYLPTGGAYTGQGTTMSITGTTWGTALPGMGRSYYAGMNIKF